MCLPKRTKSVVRRAIPWLAVLALSFAWSGQAIAQTKPLKPAPKEVKEREPKAPREPRKPGKANTYSGTATISAGAPITIDGKAKPGDYAVISGTIASDGGGLGQFPATLDQALNAALETSPKVMEAKAKLTLAEAELSSARMDVARKIVQLWSERHLRQLEYDRLLDLSKRTAVPHADVINAGASVTQYEMELRCLIGNASSTASRGNAYKTAAATATFEPAKPVQLPRGSVFEKLRDALLSNTVMDFKNVPLKDVMDYIKDRHNIEIQVEDMDVFDPNQDNPVPPITFSIKGVSLGAALQALDDKYGERIKLVVRDYGLLVTTPEYARHEGYLPVAEFVRLLDNDRTAASRGRPARTSPPPERPAKPLPPPRGPVVERIRQALLTPTELDFIQVPLGDVVEYLKDKHKIEIQIDTNAGISGDMPIGIGLKGVTLGDALQAMDDMIPDLKLVVRNYGILVTTPERAREQGYLSVVEFARLAGDGGAAVSSPTFTEPEKPELRPALRPIEEPKLPTPKRRSPESAPNDPFAR